MSNAIRDRAISLLGSGYGQSQVALALGVTDSWISQLVGESDAFDEIGKLRSAQLFERVEVDKNVDEIEKLALQKVKDKLVFVKSPVEAARIYSILNGAKRKAANTNPVDDKNNSQTVTITLPKASAGLHIQLNQNNQVIEVEGRSMATLPSRALPSLAASNAQTIQQETMKRLETADSERANHVLKNLEVVIDGVPCVL